MFIYDNFLDLAVSPLHGVSVAMLSKVRSDLKELRRLWRKALLTLEFFSMPIFGILAVIAQDLIVLLLGAKWSQAGSLLGILALRGIPHTAERTLGWLHIAAGRTDRWMRWGVLATGTQLVALFAGLPFGPPGVAIAFVAHAFVIFVPALAYAGQPLGIGTSHVVSVVWRPLAGSLLTVAFGVLLRETVLDAAPPLVRIAVLTLVLAVAYLALMTGLLNVRMPLRLLFELARDFVPARFAKKIVTPRFLNRSDD
jgi:polysaccharide transporter, PST family